jgi:hypothetical protein
MTARTFQLHYARVLLCEARRRRHQGRFYWSLIAWAQKARREAAAIPVERDLFGVIL